MLLFLPRLEAGEVLEGVKARRLLRCGVSEGIPGFSERDAEGRWQRVRRGLLSRARGCGPGGSGQGRVPCRCAPRHDFPRCRRTRSICSCATPPGT
ncbi:MAG: hypothetical protein MZV49_06660 [Rhodopseudomonas palustris]|nr:hypothetical protein [Rhodopseudomonas palustris]